MAHFPALRTACAYCGDEFVCLEWHPAITRCICDPCIEDEDW